jgi:Acetyltransferase (GNAT) domain
VIQVRQQDSLRGKQRPDPIWEVRSEILHFQIGPVKLGQVSLKALTLLSNPFVTGVDLAIPITEATARGCLAVAISAMPVESNFAAMCSHSGGLRYAARYGDRYIVDLQGSFADYIKKFSKKSRGNLKRTVRKFAAANGGTADLREYRTPAEISTFRDLAVKISRASYKNKLGWGFQEGECFARQLELDAAAGRVRGYALMCGEQPTAYVFCRIDHDVIVYKHIGYDDRFAQRSPGTASYT